MIPICLISYYFLFQVVVDAGVHVPVSIVPLLKSKTRAHYKKKTVPPKAETRRTRGPLYYKCVHVDYDKAEGKMKLPPGMFVDALQTSLCLRRRRNCLSF